MAKKKRRGRKPNLRGTRLSIDSRNGIYVWRRVHKKTGKVQKRSTETKILEVALRKAQQFEEEYQRELAGLSKFKVVGATGQS